MKSIALILLLLLNFSGSEKKPETNPSRRVLALINNFRAHHGLMRLKNAPHRQFEIDLWAKRLEKRFQHASNGYACENIAINFESPEELFTQWKESPGHRKNMLLKGIRYAAVGIHTGTYKGQDGAVFGVFRGYYGKFNALKQAR